MKNIKSSVTAILMSVLIAFGFSSCSKDIFDIEMYEKIFSFLSDGDHIFKVVHPFEDGGSTSNLSIYCSGSKPIEEDVVINIELDNDSLFDKYNEVEHDLDSVNFAKKLDASRFTIDKFTATMNAFQEDPYVAIPIRVDVNGLSPDSIYFIPLRIKDVSGGYKINEKKRSILYRPVLKNRYATENTSTYRSKGSEYKYRTNGVTLETGYKEEFGASKIVYPIGENKVRVTLRHNVSLNANNMPDLDVINKYSMVVEVDEDNKLTVYPYNEDECLYLFETLEPGEDEIYYNNTFRIESGRDCFFLNFKYKEKTGSGKRWFKIEERLRRDQ